MEPDYSNIDPDTGHKIFHKGFNAGQEHMTSSPQTVENINNLKIEISVIKQIITDGFTQNSKEHQEMLKSFEKGLDTKDYTEDYG